MLLVNNLKFERSEKIIFENINIAASPGKIVFVKGNNGTGKTTLLKVLVKILEPSEGDIFWMGKKIKNNIFNFYQETTFIMDKPTSALEMNFKAAASSINPKVTFRVSIHWPLCGKR